MAELTKSEQVAYDISAERTKKQAARNRGAAEALNGVPAGAVERARARALGQVKTPVAPRASSPAKPTLSGRTIKHSSGMEVPEEIYDWPPERQRKFLELKAADLKKDSDDNAAMRMINQLLDLRDADRREIAALRTQMSTALTVVEGLQRRLEQIDTVVTIEKSNELSEQLASVSDAVIHATAVEASLRNQTSRSQAEMDNQAAAAARREWGISE